MICEPGVKKICPVPKNILDILQKEVEDWGYENDITRYVKSFGSHKARIYKGSDPLKETKFSDEMTVVFDWLKKIAGEGTVIARSFLNLMEPFQKFPVHVDALYLHAVARRLHIPITNTEKATYYIYRAVDENVKVNGWFKEYQYKMEYGYLYELDNINPHTVENGDATRINLIADLIHKDQITMENMHHYEPVQRSWELYLYDHGIKIQR